MARQELRGYQMDLVKGTRNHFMQGKRRTLIQCPVGGGKTSVMAELCESAFLKGKRVMALAHRIELVDQITERFRQWDLDVSHVAAGYPFNKRAQVFVGSIQTVVRRLHELPKIDLLLPDEAHRFVAKSFLEPVKYFDPFVVGFTATPCRLGGEPLSQVFDSMVLGPPVSKLIEWGYLADYDIWNPSVIKGIDLSKVNLRGGDFNREDINEIMSGKHIIGSVIENYQKISANKRAIVFCSSVERSKEVAKEFLREGISSASIDGKMDKHLRREIIAAFRNDEIKVLTNQNLVTEGFDLPELDTVIHLRPTASKALNIQMNGRCLRPSQGKRAIIIDHVDNWKRHGLPDDDMKWSLDGNERPQKKQKDEDDFNVKVCEQCFLSQKSTVRVCENCGQEFVVKPRAQPEVIDGELSKLDKEKARREARSVQAKAETYEQLVAIGRAKKYKSPERWAEHILRGRKLKEEKKAKELDEMYQQTMLGEGF